LSRSFRYCLILLLAGLGTGLAAVAGWRYARISSPVSGPIVLVSIEALRPDRLAAYGSRRVPTPAIDGLARDGVLFERAFSHSPQTLPAHTALLSGRLPFDGGVRDNVAATVPASTRLLAQMLRDRGFATAGVVSSFALRRDTGLATGFTFFDDELPETRGGAAARVLRDGAESITRAERWLSAAATSRAFLFLHLADPHAPYEPPAPFSDLDPYDGEVAYVDALVGRLVAYLKTQQLYEQATIVLVGAQGESLGAHGEREHGLLVFDETLHVPLIIKAAASEVGGRRVSTLVQHVDIVPTILDLVKAPIPPALPGRSIKPLLVGRDFPERVAYAESLFAFHQFGWSPLTTVTDGRFRYVSGPGPALYDSAGGAATDVSAEYPDIAARLAAALREASPQTDPVPSVASAVPLSGLGAGGSASTTGLRPGDRERFLALGFLGPRGWTLGEASGGGVIHNDITVDPGRRAAVVEAYRSAMRRVSARQWAAGLSELRALAEQAEDPRALWTSVSAVAERAGRHDVAVDAHRRLVATDATAGARLGLSLALLRARRLDEAQRHGELAATGSIERAQRVKAYEVLARIALARRDGRTAQARAQQVAEADPASPVPALIEGRLLLDRGHPEEAVSRFDEAVALVLQSGGEHPADLHVLRGDALARLDRAKDAEDAYLNELEHFPESTSAIVALATMYHAQQRRDEATALVARLTDTVSTPAAFEAAVRLWTTLGDKERAARVRREGAESLAASPARTAQQ
jgi:choline-sulfatase